MVIMKNEGSYINRRPNFRANTLLHYTYQASAAMQQTEQVLSEITTRGAGLLTNVEIRWLLEALNCLLLGYLNILLSERSLTLAGNKASLKMD